MNPPKVKASALGPQFSSCGPQQASRPSSTTTSIRSLQSKSTYMGGHWASPSDSCSFRGHQTKGKGPPLLPTSPPHKTRALAARLLCPRDLFFTHLSV